MTKTLPTSIHNAAVTCPTCGAIQPPAPTGNAETTYLRCPSCGEVWNALRYHAPRPWGR